MNNYVVGSNAVMLDKVLVDSKSLEGQVSLLEERAAQFLIINDDGAKEAAKIIKQMKAKEKEVTAFWEPVRETTYAAYKTVTDQRKAMLDPLQAAEKILKRKIDDYVSEKERKERELHEQMRKLAQAEVDRKIEEATVAESSGDNDAAEYAMMQAEIADAIANQTAKTTHIDGTTMKRTWEIDEIDPLAVPITVCGVTVHVGDRRAVETIARKVIIESDGNVVIPGVKFHETFSLSVK